MTRVLSLAPLSVGCGIVIDVPVHEMGTGLFVLVAVCGLAAVHPWMNP